MATFVSSRDWIALLEWRWRPSAAFDFSKSLPEIADGRYRHTVLSEPVRHGGRERMDGDPPPRLQGPWPPATSRDHRSSEDPPQERREVLVGGQAGGGGPRRPIGYLPDVARGHRDEDRKWQELRRMSGAESLRIGEALWTSDLARLAASKPAPRPVSLAVALRMRIESRGRVVR